MTNIVDFITKYEQKELTKLQRSVEGSYYKAQQLERLVNEQQLQVKDHTLFLGFLVYLQEQGIDALTIFRDAFAMPRHKFEHQYNMKWWSVIQLGFTFLSILKDNKPQEYKRFWGNVE